MHLEEAVSLVIGKLPHELTAGQKKSVRDIVATNHVEPSPQSGSKMVLKTDKHEALAYDLTSRDVLNLFDTQMGAFKKKLRGVILEAAQQQSLSLMHKKTIAKLKKKVAMLEERDEGINIESLEGKHTISVDDIIGVLKNFRMETTENMVTVEEMSTFKTEVNQIDERLTSQEQQQLKDIEMRDKIEHLARYIAKIEENKVHCDALEDRLVEESRQRANLESRVRQLEILK